MGEDPGTEEFMPRREVNFSRVPECTVKAYRIKPPSTLSCLREPFVGIRCQVMHTGKDGTTTMKWYPKPFANSAIRYAFYGELKEEGSFQPYVMKRFQGSR